MKINFPRSDITPCIEAVPHVNVTDSYCHKPICHLVQINTPPLQKKLRIINQNVDFFYHIFIHNFNMLYIEWLSKSMKS